MHRLVQSKQKVSEGGALAGALGGVQRVGVQLARACCARLAAALAGARGPQRLAQRLLAPPTALLLAAVDPQLEGDPTTFTTYLRSHRFSDTYRGALFVVSSIRLRG